MIHRIAFDVVRLAVNRTVPDFGNGGLQQRALGIGAISRQQVGTAFITGLGVGVRTGDRLVQVHFQVGNTHGPRFHSGQRRIVFSARGVEEDGTGDAAVFTWGVRLHAPIQPARLADDGHHADIDAFTQNGCFFGLIKRLVGETGHSVLWCIRFQHQPVVVGVHVFVFVVTIRSGGHQNTATIHFGIVAFSQENGIFADAHFTGVAPAVFVFINKDVAMYVGEPTGDKKDTHVYNFAVNDRDLHQIEDVQLWTIPVGELVVAIGYVGDDKAAVDITLAYPNGRIATLQIAQSNPRVGNRLANLGARQTAPQLTLIRQATVKWYVNFCVGNNAPDFAGNRSVC